MKSLIVGEILKFLQICIKSFRFENTTLRILIANKHPTTYTLPLIYLVSCSLVFNKQC